MRSIYEQALGRDFEKLHPKMKERFGFSSRDGVAAVGRGTMEEIWHGRFYTLPFLWVGAWRSILFPERGRNVPFTIENYAYVDPLGRETVTWLRTFDIGRRRRFDAYMIYAASLGRIVDYLGTHQHLAVDIDVAVDPTGGLRLRSGAQRFYEGPLAFSFPMFFSGCADVLEWFDESIGRYRIEVKVANRTWGPLFGYRGAFDVEWRKTNREAIPATAFPKRVEKRE